MGHSGISGTRASAYWQLQKARTQDNKNHQRAAHRANHPNDKQSITAVKRWAMGKAETDDE